MSALLLRALKSKTLWAAFGVFLVSVLTWFAGEDAIKSNPALVSIVGMSISALMVGLRFVTKTPLVPPTDLPIPVPAERSIIDDPMVQLFLAKYPALHWLLDALLAKANKEVSAPAELDALTLKIVANELKAAEQTE